MRDIHSMKKEINKLLQEIEILRKEFDKIPADEDLEALQKKMENDLASVNIKMVSVIKTLNEHKAGLKKLEEDKIELAIEKNLVHQEMDEHDRALKELGKQLKEADDLIKQQEIETKIEVEKNHKRRLSNQIIRIENRNEPILNGMTEKLKEIVQCKILLRMFKKHKSIEIHSKYRKLIEAERLRKSAQYFNTSKVEVLKAETEQCKQLVIQAVLEEIKGTEEFSATEGTLTFEEFERLCKAGIVYILSNLEKNNDPKAENHKKALREAGWQFSLTGDLKAAGYDHLYLKLQKLTYKHYIGCKKAMDMTLNDKPSFILTELVLQEIRDLTAAVGLDLQKQVSDPTKKSKLKPFEPIAPDTPKDKLKKLEEELEELRKPLLVVDQTIQHLTTKMTQRSGSNNDEITEQAMEMIRHEWAKLEDFSEKVSLKEAEIRHLKFVEFKKHVIIEATNYIAKNDGPWAEGSTREIDKATGCTTQQESGQDLAPNRWIPMLAYILYQLTEAPLSDLAQSKKACMNMWDFENLGCPKVEGFPDDLYPALQQLVYETYKNRVKFSFDFFSNPNTNTEEIKVKAERVEKTRDKDDLEIPKTLEPTEACIVHFNTPNNAPGIEKEAVDSVLAAIRIILKQHEISSQVIPFKEAHSKPLLMLYHSVVPCSTSAKLNLLVKPKYLSLSIR